MRCKNCDYPLWNLPARKCPECGTDFKPSDFHFVPNSVRFLCPHCEQQYYGTTEHGHLIPRTFNCVQCAQRIEMDEMLLLPAAGVEESRTAADVMPWLQRKQFGFFKGWLRTMAMAMVSPGRLMRAVPSSLGPGDSFMFALITQTLIFLCGIGVPFAVFGSILIMSGDRKGRELVLAGGWLGLGGTVGTLVLAALWILLTHGLLRISGSCAHGIGRTAQAMLYSSASIAPVAVPCLGVYCLGYFIWVWWMVSAILMVMEGQKTTGLRATLCVGAGPALGIAGIGSLIALIAVSTPRFSTTVNGVVIPAGSYAPTSEAVILANALQTYASSHNGNWPAHGVELVAGGNLPASNFAIMQIGHDEQNIALPGVNMTLSAFQYLPPNRMNLTAQSVAASLPGNVIAHRLGDVVFTYHGMKQPTADPGLWLAIITPDPDQPIGGPGTMNFSVAPMALLGDGTISPIMPSISAQLPAQNALRARYGLAPLPDPATVRNGAPAMDNRIPSTSQPASSNRPVSLLPMFARRQIIAADVEIPFALRAERAL